LFCSSLAELDVNTGTASGLVLQLGKLTYTRLSPSQYTCKDGCKKFAPYFSGVNEDACAVYGGKWCPNPQDCTDLKECIAKTITEAEKDMDRTLAYRNYLEGAPTIKVPTSTQECGDARAYFGFDPFFPNDDQICDDVKQLRGSRDFEVLNDFAKGGNGKKGEDLELMEPGQRKLQERHNA
jgi:hypothetical protein